MSTKNYMIDFYNVECIEDKKKINFSKVLEKIKNIEIKCHTDYKSYKRDVVDINEYHNIYTGQFRKLRDTDLPEVGIIGGASSPLQLSQGQGVLEKNCFLYDKNNRVLAWQNNIHSSTPKIFAETLSKISGCNINFYPILKSETYQTLINNQSIKVKALEIAVAKPTNPNFYERNEPISSQLVQMMETTGSDKLDLKLSTDLRLKDSNKFLSHFSLSSITELLHLEPRKAKITVIDEGKDIEYPVDLISDRLRIEVKVDFQNSKTKSSVLIYRTLKNVYKEAKKEINGIIKGI